MNASPKIIVVAGGKGGVGKTVFAAMMGICLAGFGRRTVLMDLDFSGADLHGCLNLFDLSSSLNCFFHDGYALADLMQPTGFDHLDLLPLRTDVYCPNAITTRHKRRLLAEMKKLKADYLIVDVGAGGDDLSLDVMLAADHAVVLSTGDLFSVLNSYAFIRSAFMHGVRRLVKSAQLQSAFETCGRLSDGKSIKPLIDRLEGMPECGSVRLEVLRAFRQKFRPKVVLNFFEPDEPLNNFMLLRTVVKDYLDVQAEYWGKIRYDSGVRAALREQRPDLLFTPFSMAGEDVLRLVTRRLLAAEHLTDVRAADVSIGASEEFNESIVCQKKCLLWHICPAACEGVLCARLPHEPMRKTG